MIDVGSAIGAVKIDYSAVTAAVTAIQSSLGRLSGGGSAFAKVGQAAEAGLGKVNKSVATAETSLKRFDGALNKLNPAVMLGVGAAATAAAALVVKSAFDMNATLETTQLQFETLMGDADAAREHVGFLFDFAKKTPFETGPIIEASRMLQTFGGDALNTEANLTLIGDASAAVSAPINELGFWVGRLYSNLQGGQPFGEAAMRLQELAVLSPQARAEMEALQKSGAGADEVFAVFQSNLGNFTGAMEKQATTWSGLISTLKDSLQLAAAEGLKPFFDGAKEGIASTIEALNSPEFIAGVQEFAAGLGDALAVIIPLAVKHGPALLKIVTALAVGLGGLMVATKVAVSIATLVKVGTAAAAALTAAGGAVGVLSGAVALLTGPIGLAVAAVGLLATAWAKNWGGIRDKTADAVEYVRSVAGRGVAQLRALWEKHGAGISRAVGHLWAAVQTNFRTGFETLGKLLQAGGALLRGDWEEVGRFLSEATQGWIAGIGEMFGHLEAAIEPGLEAAARRIAEWWSAVDWDAMGEQAADGIRAGLVAAAGRGRGGFDFAQTGFFDYTSAYEAGQRARARFREGWEEGQAAGAEWAVWAAGEAERQAAEAIARVAQEATSADRVLGQHAENYEFLAENAVDAGRGLNNAAVHLALSGDNAKLAADRTDKFSGALGTLGEKARAALNELNAARTEAELFTAAFQAVQADYTTELPGGDKPLVTPQATFTVTTGGLSEEDAALLERYREEAAKLEEEIRDLTTGVGTYGVEQEKLNEQLTGARGELEHYRALMGPLEGVVGDVSTAHRDLSVNVDAVYQGIYDQLTQMPNAGEAAVAFAAATGIMSQAQAEAALKAVAVKQEIDRLAIRIAEGLPIQTALADLDSFIEKIEMGVAPAAETMAADVPTRVAEMKDAMSENALAAGEAVPAGISEGINSRLEEATSAAEGAAGDVVDAVRTVFGVESPSTVFADIGGELMVGLRDGIEDGAAAVVALSEDTADEVLRAWDYFINQAPAVGQAIMLGVMAGIEDYRGMLVAKMKEIARQAYEEMMAEIYAFSPSRLFMNTGRAMIDGIVVGLEEREGRLMDRMAGLGAAAVVAGANLGASLVGSIMAGVESGRQELNAQLAELNDDFLRNRQELLDQLADLEDEDRRPGLLDQLEDMTADYLAQQEDILEQLEQLERFGALEGFTGAAGSLLSGAMGVFRLQADALEDQMSAAQGPLVDALNSLSDFTGGSALVDNLMGMTAAEQLDVLRGLRYDYAFTSNPEAMRRLEAALHLATERNTLEQEYIRQQEELAALQEAQRQLDFLGYQVDLLKLISENGLDASILDGLTLGLDANMTDIIAAMTAAVQQLIAATEDQLDIASPSGVFRDIGENIMEGLERGIVAADPAAVLQGHLDAMGRVFDPARSPVVALQEQFVGLGDSLATADALWSGLAQTAGRGLPGVSSTAALAAALGRVSGAPAGLLAQPAAPIAAGPVSHTVNIFGGLHYEAAVASSPDEVFRSLYYRGL